MCSFAKMETAISLDRRAAARLRAHVQGAHEGYVLRVRLDADALAVPWLGLGLG